jgi:DNA-binding PucR family transcriptional regulator
MVASAEPQRGSTPDVKGAERRQHLSLVRDIFDDRASLDRRLSQALSRVPSYEDLALADLLPGVARNQEIFYKMLSSDAGLLDAEDVSLLRLSGSERADQGVSLEDLVRGWRLAYGVFRDHAYHCARAHGHSSGVLLQAIEASIAWVDAGLEAAAAGHRDAEIRVMRQWADHRMNFVRRALTGTLSPSELRRAADAFGLDCHAAYYAVRARPADLHETRTIEATLQPTMGGRSQGMMVRLGEEIYGFSVALPVALEGPPVGVAPPVALADLDRGFRLAGRALDVALATGVPGTAHFNELGVLPAVIDDAEVAAAVTARYLEPLESLGDKADALLDTVEAFIQNGLRYEAAAAELFLHVNTVRNRVRRFEEATGRSLRNGDDILGTAWALRNRRLSSTT